ncbi:MAG: flavodoxin-dependent (E)-4-hydroxy-3-methylbut-2-enyl-diphosphate synthase [Desulfovibrionales bacterium]|nr:flavodoxin-dependent (E)-4-hydroxy-3-methylbut-2-enyl-diphosphate synthase [Desulfovibrionales bacterium]
MRRRYSRQIVVGPLAIGGDAPVVVQSMTNTLTRDVGSTVRQIHRLEKAGCEVVRVAVPDPESAEAIKAIRKKINIPLIADIHFDYRLALAAINAGADGVRINPGNIGGIKKLAEVVAAAKGAGIAMRIGVNSGSLEKDILKKHRAPTAPALAESALRNIELVEGLGFANIKVSLKSSDVRTTVDAYRELAGKVDYPLHLGVTEAGGLYPGTVKSSIGIGLLLYEGIGDTLRVSLTRDPVEEVRVGYEILRALGLRQRGPEIISCPTCGRCEINLFSLVDKVEKRISHITVPFKVAIMGCVVNGPGEAKEADIGMAGGKGVGIIFRHGKLLKKVKEAELVDTLVEEIETMETEYYTQKGKENAI